MDEIDLEDYFEGIDWRYFNNIEYAKRWKLLIVRMLLLKIGIHLSDRDKNILNLVIRYCSGENVDNERYSAIGLVYKLENLRFGSVYESEFDAILFILLSNFEKATENSVEFSDSIFTCLDYLTEIGISETEIINEIVRIIIG